MAGLGISYRPPRENLAIFDATVFFGNETPLTIENGLDYFLAYPNAQGTENMQTTNIAGVLTCGNTAVFTDNITAQKNITLTSTSPLSSIQFGDGTQQTTASTNVPLSPDPTGTYTLPTITLNSYGQTTSATNGTTAVVPASYTNTNLTVNQYGQITAASNGASPAPTLVIYNGATTSGTFTPVFPAGTLYVDILVMAGGGASGTGGVVWNGSQAGSALGGGGGAGGTVYLQRVAVQAATTLTANITQGVSSYVQYTGTFGGTYLAIANWGGNGGNGDFSGANACVAGTAGVGGGSSVYVAGTGQSGTAGSVGTQQNSVIQTLSPPPWNLVNKQTSGGVNYLSKTFGLQVLTYGATSSLNGTTGVVTYEGVSVGGIYFWCYSS